MINDMMLNCLCTVYSNTTEFAVERYSNDVERREQVTHQMLLFLLEENFNEQQWQQNVNCILQANCANSQSGR